MPERKPGTGLRLLIGLTVLALCQIGAAQDQKEANSPADSDLLEFLGTVDSGADSQAADDGSWIEYLAQTDIGKVAKAPNPNDPSRKQAPAGDPPPASGDKKNE